ncbi:MAG: hypothetical protein LBC92_03690 [Rickettsiales bacterium]|jgi:hypothetical protein|nr:hypothetical protein [Rickettsiales bacterium]
MLEYINSYFNTPLTYITVYRYDIIFCVAFVFVFLIFIIKTYRDKNNVDDISYVFDFKKFKEKKVPYVKFYYPVYDYSQEKDIGFIIFFLTASECRKFNVKVTNEDGNMKISGLMRYLNSAKSLNPLDYGDALQTGIYGIKPYKVIDYYENNEEGSEMEIKYTVKDSRGSLSLESVSCFCPKNLVNRLTNYIEKQKKEFHKSTLDSA